MTTEAKKPLSLLMATALVIGNMIGSGIFLLPATMAPFGAVSLLGWAFTIAGALLLALTFSWLARARPAAGGIYAYTKLAFGDFAVAGEFLLGAGVLAGEADENPLFAKPSSDLPGLKNFAKVSDILYRGQQPTAEGMAELKKMGITSPDDDIFGTPTGKPAAKDAKAAAPAAPAAPKAPAKPAKPAATKAATPAPAKKTAAPAATQTAEPDLFAEPIPGAAPKAAKPAAKSAAKVEGDAAKGRSKMTEDVLALLKKHPEGLTAAEIGAALGKTDQNIYVWYSKLGKHCNLTKPAPGKFALGPDSDA